MWRLVVWVSWSLGESAPEWWQEATSGRSEPEAQCRAKHLERRRVLTTRRLTINSRERQPLKQCQTCVKHKGERA